MSDRIIKPLGCNLRELTSVVAKKRQLWQSGKPFKQKARHTCYRQTQAQPSMSRDSQWFVVPATVNIWRVCQIRSDFLQHVNSPTCTGETSEPSFVLQTPIRFQNGLSSGVKVFSPSHCIDRTFTDARPRDFFFKKRVWRVWGAFVVTLNYLHILKGIVLGRSSDIRR